MTIAIDGPVGAGKSTIAKELARKLGILYLDTGAMYRALALAALREGIDPRDEAAAEALAGRAKITVQLGDKGQRTFLGDEEVTDKIREPEVSGAASAISTVAGVRRRMVALQQQYAAQTDIVLDGRDIGTRVLPDATHKFFLTGDPEVRARRRYEENLRKGIRDSFEEVYQTMVERDRQDRERAVDPLRRAEDAVEIDTTALDIPGVVEALLQFIREDKA